MSTMAETMASIYQANTVWGGIIGFACYESLRVFREGWYRRAFNEVSYPAYFFILTIACGAIAYISAFAVTYLQSDWIFSVLLGFFIPTAGSRWLLRVFTSGGIPSETNRIEASNAIMFWISKITRVLFG